MFSVIITVGIVGPFIRVLIRIVRSRSDRNYRRLSRTISDHGSIYIPALQFIARPHGTFSRDIGETELFVIIQTEGQRLIVGERIGTFRSIRPQNNTHTPGFPFGIENDIFIRHSGVEVKRHIPFRIFIPAHESQISRAI